MNELELFTDALARTDPADRAAFLDRACAGNPDLRRRMDELLAGHARGCGFLDSPLSVPPDGTCAHVPEAERPNSIATGPHHPEPSAHYEGTPTHDWVTAHAMGTVIAGRYTLVGVLGQGGMGTVYRAEQTTPVKRQVALKLIKSGMDSRAVLARFDAERQALALMDHPNIARIYDGGVTPAGQPFFVMELVKGVQFTEYCDSHRLSVDARLQLFVSVCQAVQHAHQKGIIHRDLKPGNVLVTEVDGRPTPKVIDFGVAKATELKLTDMSFADTGAIVGTPAYMSPEQADPSSMDIDTRTDVYALGVILYELLTGSPPLDSKQFKRGAILEILRMVREVEPPRPSTKLSKADALPNIAANRNIEPAKLAKLLRGELDWVVMKALEKDRARRYGTANDFAQDIQRYLADEVVEARPPSRGYRLKKFVKRNRVQVVAASLVLLALIGGIIGTTWQAIRADDAAEQARLRELDAVAARNAEKTVNGKLIESREELLRSNDQLLTRAARSLLRPLAVQVQPNQPLPPLNEQETEPLWELASLHDDPLRVRFVEVALHDPVSTRRLRDRSAFALQAAVGLDPTRRTQVEALLGRRLQAKDIPEEQQEYVALCLAHLGIGDRSLAGSTTATLIQAMTKTTDPYTLPSLARGLSAVAAHLEPRQAATTLTEAMTKTTDPNALLSLAQGLSAVAAHLEPKQATEVCGRAAATLIHAITKNTDPNALFSLAQGLSAVAVRLEPKEAAETAATLIHAITKNTDPNALFSLARGLSAVAILLEPKQAAETAATLIHAITKNTDPNALFSLAQGLLSLAVRLDPKEAAEACGQAAATLAQAMARTSNLSALKYLSQGLSAVAVRLDPKQAAETIATLTQAIAKNTDPNALWYLSQGLSAVAVRLEPKQAAATLTQAMTKNTDPNALWHLAQGLSAVATRMEPKQAGEACAEAAATLTQAMTKTTNLFALQYLAQGLSAVGLRMEPKQAAETAATLTQAITKNTDPNAFQYLAQGLSAMAIRMEPKQASATLTHAMTGTTTTPALQYLAQGLSVVAARMEPKQAAEACGQATVTLIQAMITNPLALQYLVQGLLAVAIHLEPKEAAEAAATLTKAITENTDPYALRFFAEGLSMVAARMESKQAAEACGQAAVTLTHAITSLTVGPTTARYMQYLAQGLSAVAVRMEPKQAAEACGQAAAALTQAITKNTNPYILQCLSQGLSAVATRIEPKQAAEVASALTQAMTKTTDPNALQNLAQGLSAAATRIEPKQAAATLIQAMTKTTDPNALRFLADGLSAVLAREASTTTRKRLLGVTAMVTGLLGPGPPCAALGSVQPALEPIPPPLPAQTLVDLLKQPFCVGEARHLVLEQLSRHYHRPFADQWEFVEYVIDNKLPLDLTTPPVRPR